MSQSERDGPRHQRIVSCDVQDWNRNPKENGTKYSDVIKKVVTVVTPENGATPKREKGKRTSI